MERTAVSDSTEMRSGVDEAVDLAGIALRNPVLTASGTFGYGTEFAPFLDLRRIGGFVAKSLTLEPRFGNPPPRIAEAPSGLLNAISLENVGVEAFLRDKLPAISADVTCRLAAAALAHQRKRRPPLEIEIDPIDRPKPTPRRHEAPPS